MKLTLPVLFENRMKDMLQEEWEEFLTCFEEDRYQALRLNTLKIEDSDKTLSLLREGDGGEQQEFPSVPWAKAAYYYSDEYRPGRHPFHEMGLYYIQEPSAMSAAAVLAPEPGMRVLDLCAAPGGKTTQLAAYMKQQGLLVANEINPQRARILSQNVERMGIRNCLVLNEDSESLRNRFSAFFHKILVDAPCSGEGMFRKNPLAMNEWSPQNVTLCAQRQAEILDNAAAMLLPGGELVYSTCTFAPEENERTISAFLQRHNEFISLPIEEPAFSKGNYLWTDEKVSREQIENTARLWPHRLHGEGHFVAKLVKAGDLPDLSADYKQEMQSRSRKKTAAAIDKERMNILHSFLDDALISDNTLELEASRYTLFGDHLYLMPQGAPAVKGIRVLRSGLELGEFKKNRFEPAHALALALSPEEVRAAVNLKAADPRAEAFYRGEALSLREEDFISQKAASKGWCLVCIEGYSAGWGKLTGSTLKNHYPKGLRYDYSMV